VLTLFLLLMVIHRIKLLHELHPNSVHSSAEQMGARMLFGPIVGVISKHTLTTLSLHPFRRPIYTYIKKDCEYHVV